MGTHETGRTGERKDIASICPVTIKCLGKQESTVENTKVIRCVERLGNNVLILVSYVK